MHVCNDLNNLNHGCFGAHLPIGAVVRSPQLWSAILLTSGSSHPLVITMIAYRSALKGVNKKAQVMSAIPSANQK